MSDSDCGFAPVGIAFTRQLAMRRLKCGATSSAAKTIVSACMAERFVALTVNCSGFARLRSEYPVAKYIIYFDDSGLQMQPASAQTPW